MNLFVAPHRLLAVSLIALAPLCAKAELVFRADFSGPGSGTGGPSDIVAYGGTGRVLNANPAQSNVEVAFSSANPLAAGTGGYLQLTDKGQRTNANRPAGVLFIPASDANSFDAWYADTSATLGHDTLNGAFDFLFRTSSHEPLGQSTLRFFDINGGDSGYRLALASTSVNNLQFTLH